MLGTWGHPLHTSALTPSAFLNTTQSHHDDNPKAYAFLSLTCFHRHCDGIVPSQYWELENVPYKTGVVLLAFRPSTWEASGL